MDLVSTSVDTCFVLDPCRDVALLPQVYKEVQSTMTLSNSIRKLRFEHGEMTQKQLAERVGVSRQTMNAIENCRHAPTVAVAIRIADVFHVSVDQLFNLDYDGKPARCEPAATVTIDRSQATIEEKTEVESRREPVEKVAERRATLADLRNVIGP